MAPLFSSGSDLYVAAVSPGGAWLGVGSHSPAAVNSRQGDGGLPKSLPLRVAGITVDSHLTSDLHKWLQDSPSERRLIAAVTRNTRTSKM